MTVRIITGVLLAGALAVILAMGGWVFSVSYMLTICVAMFESVSLIGAGRASPSRAMT